MSVMIDQMEKANNRERGDRESESKQSEPNGAPEDVSGSYYYDDTTGYEIYREDEDAESSSDNGEIQRDNVS